MEVLDNQPTATERPYRQRLHGQTSIQVDRSPVIITKKWLCLYLQIPLNSGQRAERLRRLVATETVLSHLKLNMEQWNQISDFTVEQSNGLRDILRLPLP